MPHLDPATTAAPPRPPSSREYAFRRLYVRERWRRLGRTHPTIAIFGAGHHTRWLLDIVADLDDGPAVTAIIDDTPRRRMIGSIPVYASSSVPDRLDAVLVSSDCIEDRLADRAIACFGPAMPVVRLYEDLRAGPFPWPLHEGPLLHEECLLVCDTHRFVYCPIQKVASTSLVDWFLRVQGVTEDVPRLMEYSRARYSVSASERPMPDEYFSFVFVRNPWSRLVTAYLTEFVRAPRGPHRSDYEVIWKTPLSFVGGLTFREFMRYVHETRDMLNPHWSPQHWFLGDVDFDFIGRLETFDADFRHVQARTGVTLDVKTRNRNRYQAVDSNLDASGIPARDLQGRASVPHYTCFYTDDLIERAAEIYAEDIDRFGYAYGETIHAGA